MTDKMSDSAELVKRLMDWDAHERAEAHRCNFKDYVNGPTIRKAAAAISALQSEATALREATEARERDLYHALASLRNLEAATGEYLEGEEAVMIGEIEDEQKLRERAALGETEK